MLNNKNHENIFTSFLSSLGVKYTYEYANKHFNEHPNKYNLLGISQMLSEYGIANNRATCKPDQWNTGKLFCSNANSGY